MESYIEYSECGYLQRCIHTLVFGSTIEGAESRLGRSIGLAVDINVATGGASLTLQYQRLGWRHQQEREKQTCSFHENMECTFRTLGFHVQKVHLFIRRPYVLKSLLSKNFCETSR